MDHQTLWLVKDSCCLVVGNQRSLWSWEKKSTRQNCTNSHGLECRLQKLLLTNGKKWQYKVNEGDWGILCGTIEWRNKYKEDHLNAVVKRKHVKIQALIIFLFTRPDIEFRMLRNYTLARKVLMMQCPHYSSDFQNVECRGGFKPNYPLEGETFLDIFFEMQYSVYLRCQSFNIIFKGTTSNSWYRGVGFSSS